MKKLVAILLLLIFIFNLIGYKAVFYYLQSKSQESLQASLDKQEYNENDLITIKVPLSLPYFTNWSEFEQYNGSIEINGQHYNYVKRKVYNDTLIMLCIPNKEQNRLSVAKSEFENLLNTVQTTPAGNKTSNTALLLKALLGEYKQDSDFYEFPIFQAPCQVYKPLNDNRVVLLFATSPWQPPETV